MNTNIIRIVCLMDRSSSMLDVHAQSIDSYNEFIGKLKADNHGACLLKLIQFDDRYEPNYDLPLQQVPALTDKTFIPRGMTAYYDALGRAMDDLGKELASMPEAARPGGVIFVTLTDGKENASKHYTHGQLAEKIKHQQDKYNWTFVYLGANHDVAQFASSLNIPTASVMQYTSSVADPEAMYNAYNSAANFVNRTRAATVSGQSTRGITFDEQERNQALNSQANSQVSTSTTTTPEPVTSPLVTP